MSIPTTTDLYRPLVGWYTIESGSADLLEDERACMDAHATRIASRHTPRIVGWEFALCHHCKTADTELLIKAYDEFIPACLDCFLEQWANNYERRELWEAFTLNDLDEPAYVSRYTPGAVPSSLWDLPLPDDAPGDDEPETGPTTGDDTAPIPATPAAVASRVPARQDSSSPWHAKQAWARSEARRRGLAHADEVTP